jgi:hypothetical protein
MNVATSATRTARSNAQGIYTIAALPAGAYTVTATASGFQTLVDTTQVTLNGTTGLNLKLEVGSASESVTVAGGSEIANLQTETHEVSQSLDEQQLTDLPTNGRNILNLAALGPGAQPGSDVNTAGGGAAEFFNMTPNTIFLSGMSNVHTSFLVDGVSDLDLLTLAANVVPSAESVQEVNTEVNGASARFGQPSTVNMITKSGSDTFHGTAYDFIQNDALDAANYFSTSVPKQRYNQFGVNLGGPILKKKLFFFFDYSGLRSELSTVSLNRVPTGDERQGIFDEPGDNPIYDPLSYNAATGNTTAYANNTITEPIDALAATMLQYIPLPNVPMLNGYNYRTNLANTANNDQYLGRVDWTVSDKNHLYGSVVRANTPTLQPSIGLGNLWGTLFKVIGTNIAIEDTQVFSPHLVNIARLGFNRMVHFEDIQGAGKQNYTQTWGLMNLAPLPGQWAPPAWYPWGGAPGLGNPYAPDGGTQNRFQYGDELDYTVKGHSIYAGIDVYRTQWDGGWVITQNGMYQFSGAFTQQYIGGQPQNGTGNPFADALLGYAQYPQGATGTTVADFRAYDMGAYLQDDWKISKKLTVNLGLRYDFENPPADKNGHTALWNFTTNTPTKGAWNTNYGDLAPRVGFAWQVLPNTVLRGGAGIYYAQNIYNWLQAELLYPPNFIAQTPVYGITAPTLAEDAFVANPPLTGQTPYTLAKKLPDTSAQQWNFGIERSLLNNRLVATAIYSGMAGKHIQVLEDGNQPLPTGPAPFSTRPDPSLGSAVLAGNFGISNYNGLLTSLSGNPIKGLTMLASYTWSKSMDEIDGDDNFIENAFQHRLTYGLSGWDRTNYFALSNVYELPFGPGKQFLNTNNLANRLITGGWQIGEVYHLGSGQTTAIGANNEADDSAFAEMFANKLCDPTKNFTRSGLQWFNPACFAQPTLGTYGVGGRAGARGPRLDNLDFSAVKNFQLHEKHQFQFRAEAFNALNHPNLSLGPGENVNYPTTLGVLTYASPARVLQFGLRYSF